ncbi:putative tail fiber protein [Stenotrophomonas maltophilia phage vB_SmaM_Ps15]|uniref:Tail fiber protein n=1 Tax=Stenotrophomonas maltophilia phage vB_SmaM_Ps15 TaxID=3071007 RepID=A0AAE9FN26_9CAUD|nr:tail fiber protein [Stenotrophomonas maltophilia phage vB_SmaM_Ps15]UMO77426.1 putative tail fiber protein [Stenotrophomonas maltophilia phage vB_SmaM_Ps15]
MANVRPIVRKNGVMTQMRGADVIDPSLLPYGAPIGYNVLINGGWKFWQRGTSKTLNAPLAAYVADRWQGVCGGDAGASLALSRQKFAIPVDSATHYGRFATQNATANTDSFICQIIEGVGTFAGKTTTASFYGWANASNTPIGVRIIQRFGSGGSPEVETEIGLLNLNITPGYVSITFDVPSIAGKTIGSNDMLFLIFDFCKSSGYGDQLKQKNPVVAMTMNKWELGTTRTTFADLDDAAEFRKCQRYYEKSYNTDTEPGTTTVPGAAGSGARTPYYLQAPCTQFTVSKRVPPSISIYSPQSGQNGNVAEYNTSGNFVANRIGIVLNIGQSNFEMILGNGDATVDNTIRWHWVADAELF